MTRTGGDPERGSSVGSISADGRFVTFTSWASSLVEGAHTIHWPDVFVARLG